MAQDSEEIGVIRDVAERGRRIGGKAGMELNEEISKRVLELLGQKIESGRTISLDSSVLADTGLDSVSVMDFVMELEDEFDISIPLDRIAEVSTVADLVRAVQALSDVNAIAHAGHAGEGS